MADSPFAYYQAVLSTENPVEVVGTYGIAPYGFATAKNSGLAAPVLSAIKVLIANGTYRRILETSGIQAGAITEPSDQRGAEIMDWQGARMLADAAIGTGTPGDWRG